MAWLADNPLPHSSPFHDPPPHSIAKLSWDWTKLTRYTNIHGGYPEEATVCIRTWEGTEDYKLPFE